MDPNGGDSLDLVISSGEDANDNNFDATEKKVTCNVDRRGGNNRFVMSGVQQYFPRLQGHGMDSFQGRFTLESFEDTKLNKENIAMMQYDSGHSTELKYRLYLGENDEYHLQGSYSDQPSNSKGSFTMSCQPENDNEPITGWCPSKDSDKPAAWLPSWPKYDSCSYPDQCAAEMEICDAWVKHTKQKNTSTGVIERQSHYGFAMKIFVPEEFWGQKGWTIALRFPPGQRRAAFNTWNAQFFNVFQNTKETVVVVTQRWKKTIDLVQTHSFMFTVDYLITPDPPSILFWPVRTRNEQCFKDSFIGRSDARPNPFQIALNKSRTVKHIEDVTSVQIKNKKLNIKK